MSRYGRGAVATTAQRAEVRRLAAEGTSIRQIAARVFGDARFRGRVERILQAPLNGAEASVIASDAPAPIDVTAAGTTAVIRHLIERRLKWLTENSEAASGNEILRLLHAERRLMAMEAYERQQHAHQARRN